MITLLSLRNHDRNARDSPGGKHSPCCSAPAADYKELNLLKSRAMPVGDESEATVHAWGSNYETTSDIGAGKAESQCKSTKGNGWDKT